MGELKRRNVFRVAIAYAVAAWLLIQIAETIFPLFGFDDTPARIVVILLAIGFPLTLIISWVYELTPEGLKLEKDVDRSRSVTHHTGKKLDRGIIVVLTLALAYFAIDEFVFEPARDAAEIEAAIQSAQDQATYKPDLKSIAVLPFANMSADASNTYFSDGLADTVLHMLAQIRGLRVAARTSSFQFRDQAMDVAKIGEQLNVGTILEGSLQRSGDTIRVTAQLIDVNSGYHLWSGNFDRNLDDVFAIQDEIASQVVSALQVSLLGDEIGVMSRGQTDNIDAYTQYLLGVPKLNDSVHASLKSGAEHLREAVRLDPDYAQAWAMLGLAYVRMGQYGAITAAEAAPEARNAASRALDLDENSTAALSVLGNAERWDGNTEAAEILFKKAYELGPNDTVAMEFYGLFLEREGRLAEAETIYREMIRIDPLSEKAHERLAVTFNLRGMYAEAKEVIEKYKRINPNTSTMRAVEYLAARATGEWADAVSALTQTIEIDPDDVDAPAALGIMYLTLNMPAEARFWFDRAIQVNSQRVIARAGPILLNYYLQQNDDNNYRLAVELLEDNNVPYWFSHDAALLAVTEYAASTDRHDAVLKVLSNLYPHLFDNPPYDLDRRPMDAYWVGKALIQSGDVERGSHLVRSFLNMSEPSDDPNAVTVLSVAGRLLLGDIAGAMDKLSVGVQENRYHFWDNNIILEWSSELDPIRDDPAFVAVLEEAREHARQQRELLQAMEEESASH
jgi:TolB-like protein/Flp pilus assembly protein TadD